MASAEIAWTEQALADLSALSEYIARDSTYYALLMEDRILNSVERLSHFPRSGRIVPEVGDETLREIILGYYRIVYRLHGLRVQIVTIHHAAMPFRESGADPSPPP